jgi:uncharacterized repeat protein (TIGR03803 family)
MAYTTAAVHTGGRIHRRRKMRKISGPFGAVAGITALMGMMLAAAIPAPAQTFKTLADFNWANGASPYYMSLVRGSDGNLYGTDWAGGSNNSGTVFRLTPAGQLSTLYGFCAQTNCSDGEHPGAGLLLANDGSLYGTTYEGGTSSCGTVFRISSPGALTTLLSFDSTNGANPVAGVIQATDGNLYGTTTYGGPNGYGTVFRITPQGSLTTLHSFDATDGAFPTAALVESTNGDLYGTTTEGGATNNGTVFRVTANGALKTLHSFNSADGGYPSGALVQTRSGIFYGTTTEGGSSNYGTIFKITSEGSLTMLHSFDSMNGAYPYDALIQATDGNLYGTTADGGSVSVACSLGCGTIFKVTAAGTLTTLHRFNGSDGENPLGGLVQSTDGRLYGVTQLGGTSSSCPPFGCGTAFGLSLGLGAFAETLPPPVRQGAQ